MSSSLLDRVKDREPEAWRRLVRLYGPLVYQWCQQCGLQTDDVADVMQEVFGAVAAHVAEFRHDRPGDSFRGWLWTITRNKLRDHFRGCQGRAEAQGGSAAQQRLAAVPERAPEISASDHSDGAAPTPEYQALEALRAEFEDRTWRAFLRTTVDGLSATEVAGELGMSREAVYKAKSRVLRRIRQELGGFLDD